MSDIFDEIDDDLKQDQVFQWWKRHRTPVIAGVLLLVIGMGGWLAWTNYRTSQASAAGDQLAAALAQREAGETDAAASALAGLVNKGGSYGMIAAFQLADLEAARGNVAAAQAALADVKGDARYVELASVMTAFYSLDGGDSASLRSRLQALTGGKAIFANQARELLALLALRDGDQAAARSQLQALLDDSEVPSGIQNRARELLSTLPAAPAS